MARPSLDRVEIKVWVSRSAARRLAELAAERDLSRSAYVRGLLVERAKPAAAAPMSSPAPKPQAVAPAVAAPKPAPAPAPPLVTVDTPPPSPRTTGCRQCSTCPEYRPNPKRMMTCTCGHVMGVHR